MKLYLIHCGFYDSDVGNGLYESHVNFFVGALSFEDARAKVKLLPEFQERRMHVDGLQEVSAINGYVVELREEARLNGQTILATQKHRDLAPKYPAKDETVR